MGSQVIVVVGTFILLLIGLLLGYVLSQLVLGFLTFNLLTFFGTLSLILIFGTLYYVLFWQLRREQRPVVRENISTTEISDRITDNQLKNKLIAKLDGDSAEAERLIEQAKQKSPGMPESWYYERVIEDLERELS
jgi:uncharacterized membrane protein required for colicin V production